MSMSVQIPSDLQPLISQAVARGDYADEQELVANILRLAAPALESYQQLKEDVRRSVEDETAGRMKEANFDGVRQRLQDELDENGQSK